MASLKAGLVFPVLLAAGCVAPSGSIKVANATCDVGQPPEAYGACREAAITDYKRDLELARQANDLRTGNCLTAQALESEGTPKVRASGFGSQCAYSDPYTDLFYLQNNKP